MVHASWLPLRCRRSDGRLIPEQVRQGLPVVPCVLRPRVVDGGVLDLKPVDVTRGVRLRPRRVARDHDLHELGYLRRCRRVIAQGSGAGHEHGEPYPLRRLGQPRPELPARIRRDRIEGLAFLDRIDAGLQVSWRADDPHEVVQDERPNGAVRGREADAGAEPGSADRVLPLREVRIARAVR